MTPQDPFAQAMQEKEALAQAGHTQQDELDEAPQLPQGAQAQSAQSTQEEEGSDTQEEGGVELDGQTFPTQEAAFKYLREKNQKLELDYLAAESYRQGLEAGRFQPGGVTQTPAPAEEKKPFDIEKFYSNPEEFLTQFADNVKTETEQRILSKTQAQSQEEKLWADFFNKNPDLADDRDLCQLELERNLDQIRLIAQSRGQDEAMKYLAQKAKSRFQNYWERQKPQTELTRTNTQTATGANQRVTQTAKSEEPLDFVSQVRNMRKSKSARY